MTLGQITLLLFLSSCFLSFSWSIYRFFIKGADKKSGMLAIQYLGLLFTLLHYVTVIGFYQSHPVTLIMAILLYVASHMIFWSAIYVNQNRPLHLAYSENIPEHFITDGPYRYIRHPFYASYLCFWLAGLLGTMQVILLVPVWVMFFLYYKAAILEEEKFLSSQFGFQYSEYQKNTGMFLPRFKMMQYENADESGKEKNGSSS